MSSVSIKKFTCEELITFLKKHDLSEFSETIRTYDIDGTKFLKLTELQLTIWRPKMTQTQVKKLWKFIADVNQNPQKYEKRDLVVLVESRAPLSKQKLSKLYNDDKFMNTLKTALSQKQEKPVSDDAHEVQEIYENYDPSPQSIEDFDQELYENAGPSDNIPNKPKMANKYPDQDAQNPMLPPKPKTQSKVKIIKQTNQMVDDYLTPTQFEQNARNIGNKLAGTYLKLSKLDKRPDLNLKPSDMDEDYLETDIHQHQSRKPINQQQQTSRRSIPEYLDMDPKKNANVEEYLEPSEFDLPKLQPPKRLQLPTPTSSSGYDVPELMKKPTNQPIKAPPSPGHMHKLRQSARRPPSDDDDDDEVFENDVQRRDGRSTVVKSRKNSIQSNPLPAIPGYDLSTLPRPPKKVPDLEELKKLGYMTLEEFNFEQSFVAKYSSAKFYRYTDKKGAEELLSRPNTREGTYLLRPSNKNYCAMAVRYQNRVYHLAITMGENNRIKQCGKEFKDLEEMLEYFRTTPMRFKNATSMVNMILNEPLPMNIT